MACARRLRWQNLIVMPSERALAVTERVPLSCKFFAVTGALCLAASVLLAFLHSFSYIAVAAVGLFFVAAALISYSTRSRAARVPALLALLGVAIALVGTVTTVPFLAVGVGLIVGAFAVALLLRRPHSTSG